MSTKPTIQKILKGIFHTEEEENNCKHERSGKNKTQREIDEPCEVGKYEV
jgi:hypothetical protein